MDYNLTIERLNSEANLDLQQIVQESRKLRAENDIELKSVEEMYTERIRKQDACSKIENQITNVNIFLSQIL